MFIVSVEGPDNRDLPSVDGIKQALEYQWRSCSNVKFKIEEGSHKEVAELVSDYLKAEEALDRFKSMNEIKGTYDINSNIGHEWKTLYDDVNVKRHFLVGKLRQYGAIV